MSSQSEDKGKGTYVRLSREEREQLAERAAAAKRTLSGEIRLAVARHLASDQGREAA